MKKIDASIIIVNYNTKKLTLRCIGSVVRSNPKATYEIIVVDNASEEKLEKSSNYKLIENKENLGLAKAINQGIRIAKGKYILLLNSDTRVKKGAIEKLAEFARVTPDAGAVVPQLINPNGTVQASAYRLPTLRLAFCPKKLEKFIPLTISHKPLTIESAVMAAYLITPQALKKVGLLDEKYFLYYEDHDYNGRIKKAGLKVYYVPAAQVIHEHGASGGVSAQLVKSAKIYHGRLGYFLFTFILWAGQKIKRIFRT